MKLLGKLVFIRRLSASYDYDNIPTVGSFRSMVDFVQFR